MNPWDQFTGANAGYVQELYERYQQDPGSVDEATRQAFATWAPSVEDGIISAGHPTAGPAAGGTAELKAGIAAFTLAESIRRFGHLAAQLDPLGFDAPVGDPSLNAQAHGLTADDLRRLPADLVGGPAAAGRGQRARGDRAAAGGLLRATPATTTTRSSCPTSASGCGGRSKSARSVRPTIRSTAVELLEPHHRRSRAFERFLHRTFPGKTRFSIEGLDMMVPDPRRDHRRRRRRRASQHVLIGMAHRGRLNVLAHMLQKPYAQILAEFKDPLFARSLARGPGLDGRREVPRRRPRASAAAIGPTTLIVSMPPNPSHLEAVNPVVEGMARAAGTDGRPAGRAARSTRSTVLPILIHGDAAFPGQGVVAETLNLSRLAGYDVGGTIHIIANNQLGFTADAGRVVQHQLRQRPGARVQDPDRRTSTPTTRRPASRRRGWRGPTGTASSATS